MGIVGSFRPAQQMCEICQDLTKSQHGTCSLRQLKSSMSLARGQWHLEPKRQNLNILRMSYSSTSHFQDLPSLSQKEQRNCVIPCHSMSSLQNLATRRRYLRWVKLICARMWQAQRFPCSANKDLHRQGTDRGKSTHALMPSHPSLILYNT